MSDKIDYKSWLLVNKYTRFEIPRILEILRSEEHSTVKNRENERVSECPGGNYIATAPLQFCELQFLELTAEVVKEKREEKGSLNSCCQRGKRETSCLPITP